MIGYNDYAPIFEGCRWHNWDLLMWYKTFFTQGTFEWPYAYYVLVCLFFYKIVIHISSLDSHAVSEAMEHVSKGES